MFGEITHNLAVLWHYTHLRNNKEILVKHEYADC